MKLVLFAVAKIMKSFLTWKLGVIVSCSVTIGAVYVCWDRIKSLTIKNKSNSVTTTITTKSMVKRNSSKQSLVIKNNNVNIINNNNSSSKKYEPVITNRIQQLPNLRWKKIGRVKELYYYPLKSGRGKELFECEFTECGITVINKGYSTLRDRMFLVYNEETQKFITGRNYPTLILVSLSAENEFKVKLQAVGMSTMIFDIPRQSDMTSCTVNCSMWWGEEIKCIDCGSGPAKWISNFLTGTDTGLRVGLAPHDKTRNILKGPWKKFTHVYKNLTNDDVGLFADIASYMLLTESSLNELNKKLNNPISSLQLRPNIVVSDTEAFAEDNWEWIKIGESTIIRNVKPCPRCSMIQINPETAFIDSEPLKTLRSFREQTDEDKIRVDGKAPLLGIYCGLYSSGHVKIDDDIYIHVPQIVRTTKL